MAVSLSLLLSGIDSEHNLRSCIDCIHERELHWTRKRHFVISQRFDRRV